MRNSILLFFTLIILSIFISLAMKEIVYTEDVYYASLGEQLSTEKIESLIKKKGERSWIGYIVKLVYYSFKIFMVTICLLVGLFVINRRSSFSSIFGVVVKAEFVFLIPSMILLLRFGIFEQSVYTFSDIGNFAPLSLLAFFNVNEIDSWLRYPLSSINLFELLYIGSLAQGLSVINDMQFFRSFKIAFFSYGTGLITWIVFVVFLILSFSV